jgi:hypothetical protein
MKNFSKSIIYLLVILISLTACQSVKDGLTGTKRTNSDEFLVKKKNPLVLPPDYEKLPEPKKLDDKVVDEEGTDIKTIIGITSDNLEKNSSENNVSSSIEDSVLKKIKEN